ncbi:hypothetical protein D3C78_1774200 [compost metagenome]
MRLDLLVQPRCARGRFGHQALDQRGNLFPRQDAQQAYQGNHRGRGRAYVEQRIDHADQQAKRQRYQVDLHGRAPIRLRGR